ncbi:hypothetical protein E2C01_085609 [Portunus trituberculatus]|uniref:Uncharacterized protein n=1 Tax=Portunus trituberculatus TaxID=210409 RepID=A0A5B7JE44_PORTR|nr:hypothetical protein [Portunus trituberculatus]
MVPGYVFSATAEFDVLDMRQQHLHVTHRCKGDLLIVTDRRMPREINMQYFSRVTCRLPLAPRKMRQSMSSVYLQIINIVFSCVSP